MSETRALTAALSGPVFHGAATRSALHASERHVERWAPEGASATRSGGMRSLGFADRIAAPWMSAAMQSRGAQMMARPTSDRGTPEVSWLFPRPWFQDELDWMAAARQGAEAAPTFLTTRGTYASSRTSMTDVAMPMLTTDQVAPSMAGSSSFGAPSMDMVGARESSSVGLSTAMPAGFSQVQHSLRTYSPVVPFAAASAAEVVAATIGMATQSGLAQVATGSSGRSPILSGLTVVAPSALTPIEVPAARFAASAPAPVADRAMPTTTRALFEAAKAQVARVEEVRHPSATANVIPFSAPASESAAPASGESVAPSDETVAERAADRTIADASTASPDVARALRTVDLLFQAAAPAPAAATAPGAPAPAAVPTYAPSFAPSAGPRVAMPAGLGGLVTALDAQRATSEPLARMAPAQVMTPAAMMPSALSPTLQRLAAYSAEGARFDAPSISSPIAAGAPGAPGVAAAVPSFAPVWAAPSTALGSIAAERARAVDHVAWSDRWLARFVGASPVALAALDATRESLAPELRARPVVSPEQVFLQPPMPAPALAAAIRGSIVQPVVETRAAAPAPGRAEPITPSRALRIDDNEAVSDDIFAAIAAAAARPTPSPAQQRPQVLSPQERAAEAARHQEALAEARPLTPADVVRAGSRPSLADLVAISPPPAPDAGLSPGLASSPLAPAMAGVLPLPAAPTFDPRALFPEAVSSAYLGGFLARSAAPIGVVSSAPTMQALVSAATFASSMSSAGAMPMVAAPSFAADGTPVPVSASAAQAPAMPMASWMAEARAWSARDLMVAPPSLRLAEAAPARVILSADVESARRESLDASLRPSLATAAAPVVQRQVAPTAAAPDISVSDDAPSLPPAIPSESRSDEPRDASVAPAMSPAVEAELLTLRAALFAAPGPTSTPLAFAEHLPLLSAPTQAPAASMAPIVSPTIPGESRSDEPRDESYSFALPMAATAAPVGARGLALPAVGVGATLGGGLPAGMFPAATAAAAAAEPSLIGDTSAVGAMHHMQAPAAFTSSGRPGALAEMILAWSVAEERSVADLAFDFVQPEMVLAAKVYGLSPAAAAQASRLAIAGPGAIASLATSVDLTFLRGFQQLHAQQDQVRAGAPASPATVAGRAAAPGVGRADEPYAPPSVIAGEPGAAPYAGAPSMPGAPTIEGVAGEMPGVAPFAGAPSYAAAPGASYAGAPGAPGDTHAAPSLAGEILGGARLPRGAFLWPEATVAALGLRAQSPDGVAGMPVVALELLAAAAVADLGTWVTTFAPAERARLAGALRSSGLVSGAAAAAPGALPFLAGPSSPAAAVPGGTVAGADGVAPSYAQVAGAMGSPAASPTAIATSAAADAVASMDGGAADVLAPELTTAAPDMRARFEAIYVALAQTPEGTMLSPSARAARAMALLARTPDGTAAAMSPRDRALAAWSVMPQVYQGDLDVVAPSAGRAAADDTSIEVRPGLASLAARAGESLASFVNPTTAEVSGWTTSTDAGFAGFGRAERGYDQRAAGIDPVYVQTGAPSAPAAEQWVPLGPTLPSPQAAMSRPGRAFAQTGGGEPEIPSWFEAAARLALEQRSPGSGMSMAELVLVTAASTPSRAIAAATRGAAPTAAPQQVQGAGAQGNQEGEKPEVDKLAHEVYLEVLKLIDIARMRSGDPF